jgi:Lon protease-like protein
LTVKTVPLFPLQTVLFPGGPLPLRLFEPRYLDMISQCMRDSSPFGVVLLSDGSEVGRPDTTLVRTEAGGTLANVCDWYQGTDGLLGITALGADRFRLRSSTRQADGLNIGEIEILEAEPVVALPQEFASMAGLLRAVIDDLGRLYEAVEKNYDSASWVGYRFAEILPLGTDDKQHCLEMNDPLARLELLRPYLREVREETTQ